MIEFLEAAIRIATPLMFAALGGILSERAGVFAVGLEGMMLMGAFGGAVGAWASGSALVGVALAILCGATIGLVVAIVTVAYRADNMVTGLTANILAAGLTSYLMRVLSGGGRPIAIHLTPLPPWPIPGLVDIPVVGPLLFTQPPLTYLAIVGCVALASLIVARWNPFGAAIACLAFGAAEAFELRMQSFGLPVSSYIVQMAPYLIALIVLALLGRASRMPAAIGQPLPRDQ